MWATMADSHKENSKKDNLRSESSTPFEVVANKSPVALAEEKVLQFWRDNKIFQKSLDKPAVDGDYVFYDGPPFATGLPHYGHILISTIKDAVPRYQTMRGKRVERRWGWDCHGLPIENIVEKDLKVSGKKEIEALGVDRFNEYARSKVLHYSDQWKETIERIGRWVDYDGAYMTMDNTFIESVWWSLKEIWDKKLIYEGTKVLPYCPRCETPIANAEIAMDGSYKDISDISVYVKLAVENEPKIFLIVWTTTPWTLPGNTAVAVNEDLDYVIVKSKDEYYIVAKNKISIFKEEFEVVEEIKGSVLVGKKYTPPFDYFVNKNFPDGGGKKENAWKVYAAPYVTAETGSGIVHLAPAYGEEDMALAKKYEIPFVRHVGSDGTFTSDVVDFDGLKAKPKGDHQATDVLIIKNLAAKGLLFAKEKIVHSYPHCFRCETPLYYFAIPAWFIKILDVKKNIVRQNEKVRWIPEHLKHGRFGKSVEGAPDWNISRNRYWATPLPFWKCLKCEKTECVGSLEELRGRSIVKNKYLVMRHGEADNNTNGILSSLPDNPHHLTEKGMASVEEAALSLKKENIEIIVCSPFLRTRETADIVAKKLNLDPSAVIFDEKLSEHNYGDLNLKPIAAYHEYYTSFPESFTKKLPHGESFNDTKIRVGNLLYDLEKRFSGKKILLITHETPAWLLFAVARGLDVDGCMKLSGEHEDFIKNSETMVLDFAPIPHNKDFQLDFHRPYIDEINFACSCGRAMCRVPEVVDGWFESGSMPFAQHHYPFENKNKFEGNFPADFVAEYIAQTRTWFYYMLAVSTILFDNVPFKNVLTTGTVLAEDGTKMSKSKGNFPDPKLIFDKYGVDALRFYLLSSPLMKSEDLNFSEKGVDEVYKKIILRLKNVVSFYEMYKGDTGTEKNTKSSHILDRWITLRLSVVVSEVTSSMESYELEKATASIDGFIEDLSVWFLRRSRERLKSENEMERGAAISTFYSILVELSKVVAPFMPFIAEEMYKNLDGKKESVHLEDWPETQVSSVDDIALLSDMDETRRIVSFALEARAQAKVKVRQPLKTLVVKSPVLNGKNECLSLIIDEVNMKEIIFDPEIIGEVVLDTKITDELREEGSVRELVRFVQDLRKKSLLKVGELAEIYVSADSDGQKIIKKFEGEIKKATSASKILFEGSVEGEKIEIDGVNFELKIR